MPKSKRQMVRRKCEYSSAKKKGRVRELKRDHSPALKWQHHGEHDAFKCL